MTVYSLSRGWILRSLLVSTIALTILVTKLRTAFVLTCLPLPFFSYKGQIAPRFLFALFAENIL